MTKSKMRSVACSILTQVAVSLAAAEHEHRYEHRDLHTGNIVVQSGVSAETFRKIRVGDDVFRITTHGHVVTIIDYTLARLTNGAYHKHSITSLSTCACCLGIV
jgi:serine/threonine protein kinase